MILQLSTAGIDPMLLAIIQIAGLSLFAGGVTVLLAILFRWYARQTIPDGVAVLSGAALIAIYLNTTGALSQTIAGTSTFLELPIVVVNLVTFVCGSLVGVGGGRLGDWIAISWFSAGSTVVESELSEIVRTVGRVITVSLPEEIETIEGYDPVPKETIEQLQDRNLVFPRGLSVAELRDRLITRLQTEYDIGHVDIELTSDGTVSYLAVGSRVAGIGPTLPPRTKAIAVRADPPFSASPGDRVQLWRIAAPKEESELDKETGTIDFERVLTGEFRARHEDTVTLAVDEIDIDKIESSEQYRLSTLPDDPRIDREFASMLRRYTETMGVIEVTSEHPLLGNPLSALDITIIAVATDGERIEPTPRGDRILQSGDVVYALASPDRLRRLSQTDGDSESGAETPA